MKFFGRPTAKPTVVVSSTPQIIKLGHGKMTRLQLQCQVATTRKSVSKRTGKRCFQGSPALKTTQPLNSI